MSKPEIVQIIEPRSSFWAIDWKELWMFRDLFGFLVWKDLKVRYKQTVLGAGWAILVPFMQMVVFTVIFGKFAKLPSDGLPKPIFYYSALLPWSYFSGALLGASNSLVTNSRILTKTYFPRLILPTVPCITGLINLFFASVVLCLMMIYYKMIPPLTAVFIPFFIIIPFFTALGTGLFLTSLNVKYRDVRFVIPFLIQVWMFCTVIMPFSSIPENYGKWRYLYGLNPMGGMIEGLRWCLFHEVMFVEKIVNGQSIQASVPPPLILLVTGLPVMIALLVFGIYFFNHMEERFADLV